MSGFESTLIRRLSTVVIVVIFLMAGVYFLFASTRESRRLEQALLDRYGRANEYTPAADGSVPVQRLQRFVRVRLAVQPHCSRYQLVLDGIRGLTAIDTGTKMSGREMASRSIDGLQGMLTLAPKLLAFQRARNTSLLAEEMGLGEYMYIYLAAYGKQLAREPAFRYADMEEAYISLPTRDEYIQILRNQLNALKAAGPEAAPAGSGTELLAEIASLKDGSQVAPWPNGPVGKTRESLAPFHQRLSDLYCDGIVAIELQQKNRGFGFWRRGLHSLAAGRTRQ